MEFRLGDKAGASKSFDEAIALQPSLLLDPAYDASDVGAAYEDARAIAGLPAGPVSTKPPPGGAAPSPGATPPTPATPAGSVPATAPASADSTPAPIPIGDQPTGGDFAHDPALEQREDTPLPVYAEYAGSAQLSHVIVKYKGAQMRDWARLELRREGNGFAGLIPCTEVTRGVMKYWIQGFDRSGEPAAASGDPKHPYYVPIRDKLTGEAPHLPGKEPPKSCEESDCPPGIPGCSKGKKGGDSTAAEGATGSEEASPPQPQAPPGPPPRLWVGVSLGVEFLVLPSEHQVCRVDGTGKPLNASQYFCFGADPVRGTNVNFPSSQAVEANIVNGGDAPGGFAVGDIRVAASLDYAVTPNVMVGGRFGYVFNSYLGRGTVFPPLHIEGRATFLLGHTPLAHLGFVPMGFAGLGVSEFDGRTRTDNVQYMASATSVIQQPEDVWLSRGPFFVALGAGARYGVSAHIAFTGALRVNMVFGANGFLPTYGPELGVLYGF